MPHLIDTAPTDWAYLSEGGATIVFTYTGAPNPVFDGTVLRLRKGPLELDGDSRLHDRVLSSRTKVFASDEDLAAYYGLSPPPPPRPHSPEDPTVEFQRECIARLIPPAHLPNLAYLDATGPTTHVWLETLAAQCEPHRPPERRRTDGIEIAEPTSVLATDLVGGEGIAVEIKPKWGFLPSPMYLSDHTRAVKTRTCRFCMHAHLKATKGETVPRGYCPLDLYSGDESRVKQALSGLWDAWVESDGIVNSFRVFVRGKKIRPAEKSTIVGIANDLADPKEALISALLPVLMTTPVLRTLAHLQRTLDPLDIEGLAALHAQADAPLGPEPTLDEYTAFVSAYLSGGASPADLRYHVLAYLLSATFKDCSVIVRVPDGTATIIDLDAKSVERVRKWHELDWEIACAYALVPEGERKMCVDVVGQ
ncbi:inositol-pentakisphosphate 2-kinase [Mycena rosella]|uniref:Inositol-pentakisphosphate 2-kinase n=1 Tax=Mycena rosella TaxID=1033263 RepID=A0AAD7GDT1_MYCRO|nr:inositol-pentakisphosphate 2-kinase [Mycena rosella]